MKTTFIQTKKDKDFLKSIMEVLSPSQKQKQVQIDEKLSDEQKDIVDYWNHDRSPETEDAISKVFDGEYRKEYPLETHDATPHPDVEEHLNKHGYEVTDYINGKVKDKYNREMNLGKALTKTNATPEIKAAYDNDKTREAKSKSNLKVVISHHPYDVAGMTSGHQSWVDSSCMNFDSGSNRHYLPHDIEHGTHVAYLTDHEDKDLDRPIARIALKPYQNNSGHTIFRPENKIYGSASSTFLKSVHNWAETHYPADEEDNEYYKNPDVYDDSGNTSYSAMTKEEAETRINKGRSITSELSPKIVDHIHGYLMNKAKENPEILSTFAHGQHRIAFNRNQVNSLYKFARETGQKSMNHALAHTSGDALNKSNLEHALSIKDIPNLPHAILKHRYLPDHIVDQLKSHNYQYVHPANIKSHHVDKAIDEYLNGGSGSQTTINSLKDRMDKSHLMRLATKADAHVTRFVLDHPKTDADVTKTAFESAKKAGDYQLETFNQYNKNPTAEHVGATNTINGLNHILRNANDKFTHALAFHKAMNVPKGPKEKITLRGENQNKHLSDADIKTIYDNSDIFYHAYAHKDIRERLLNHAMSQIDDIHENHKRQQQIHMKFDHDDIHDQNTINELQHHFAKHAEFIDDALGDHRTDSINGRAVDIDHVNQLHAHNTKALEHPLYHHFSKEEADYNHEDNDETINEIHENLEYYGHE